MLRQHTDGDGVVGIARVGRGGTCHVALDSVRASTSTCATMWNVRRAPAASEANAQHALPPTNVAPGARTHWHGRPDGSCRIEIKIDQWHGTFEKS